MELLSIKKRSPTELTVTFTHSAASAVGAWRRKAIRRKERCFMGRLRVKS
jgi:hypothetical protein